jgi:hypothetical protein
MDEQFGDYLHLEEAEAYVDDLMEKRLEEFKTTENEI